MKKLLVAVAMSCLVNSLALATAFESRKPVLCDEISTLINSLTENYNELPVWTARNPNDNTRYTLFVNDKNGHWTLVQMNSEFACIIGVGEESKIRLGQSV